MGCFFSSPHLVSSKKMSDKKIYDVIIIGSGPAGVHAALPIVAAGFNVALIDGGVQAQEELESQFPGDFETIRKNSEEQHHLFLGGDLSGIPSLAGKKSHTVSMTSGTRAYIAEKTAEALQVETTSVEVMQSLAKGGLSETWGAVCDILTEQELKTMGIPSEGMHEHYQAVIDTIGISGIANGYHLQPPIHLDHHGRKIQERARQSALHPFKIKQPLLGVLTQPLGNRKPLTYKDVEYWLNPGNSIYRARFTLEELEKKKNMTYLPGYLVKQVVTSGRTCTVRARHLSEENGKEQAFRGKRIILAAGAMNTTRILLKSCNLYNISVPIMVKPHVLMPCLHPAMLGVRGDIKRTSFCQLVLDDTTSYHGLSRSFSQLYSYKSLLLYKLIPYSPLPMPETLSFLARFVPSLVICDARFPTFSTHAQKIRLIKKEDRDVIELIERKGLSEIEEHRQTLREIKKQLFRLGLIPLKVVETPFGSTAHYAGGVPNTTNSSAPLRTTPRGKVIQLPNVYVADAATWTALSAKPPALTIMANARRIGFEVLNDLQKRKKSDEQK